MLFAPKISDRFVVESGSKAIAELARSTMKCGCEGVGLTLENDATATVSIELFVKGCVAGVGGQNELTILERLVERLQQMTAKAYLALAGSGWASDEEIKIGLNLLFEKGTSNTWKADRKGTHGAKEKEVHHLDVVSQQHDASEDVREVVTELGSHAITIVLSDFAGIGLMLIIYRIGRGFRFLWDVEEFLTELGWDSFPEITQHTIFFFEKSGGIIGLVGVVFLENF